MEKTVKTSDMRQELETAIRSQLPLDEIVALLRRHKDRGATREEVYTFLTSLRDSTADEAMQDRIVEVADFVAGFCAPHMRIWDN
jgi:hypothetical protein